MTLSLVKLTPVGGDSKNTERKEAQKEKDQKEEKGGKKEEYQYWTGKRKGKCAEEERV